MKKHALRLFVVLALLVSLTVPASASPLLLDPNGSGIFDTITAWIVEVAADVLGWEKSGCGVDPNGNPIPCTPDSDGPPPPAGGCIDPWGVPCVIPPKP